MRTLVVFGAVHHAEGGGEVALNGKPFGALEPAGGAFDIGDAADRAEPRIHLHLNPP
jgi:hypothetical protein